MIGGEVIEALAWEHRRAWHDETTVGASPPFPHTLASAVLKSLLGHVLRFSGMTLFITALLPDARWPRQHGPVTGV